MSVTPFGIIGAVVSDEQNIEGYPTYEEARQEMIDLWNTRTPEKEANNEL